MRIAYIINSLEGGGTTVPLPALFDVMRAHGADIRLLALRRRDGKGLAQVERSGVDYRICEPDRDVARTYRWMGRELADWTPDLLWTSLTRATLLGQWYGRHHRIPVVSWQHNLYLKPANRRLLRLSRRRSALWIADSDAVAEMARKRLRIAPDRLMTWPIFQADPTSPAPHPPHTPLRLGSLGRLHRAKGYDLLIEAMALLERRSPPDYRVSIAGRGDQEDALRTLAARRGVAHRLDLVGHSGEPADFLASLDAYLQPSRREGFGIAAHEAMAASLPILASRIGEMATTIARAGGGFTVPVGKVAKLADALEAFLQAKADWPTMGAANRDHVGAHFSRAAFTAAGNRVMERVKTLL